MESRYGIGINNRYALFLDEEGEENEDILVTKAREAAENTKKAKEAEAKAAAAAAAAPKPAAPAAQQQQQQGGQRRGVQERNDRNREGESKDNHVLGVRNGGECI